MKLVTAFELAAKKTSELHALYSKIAGKVMHCKADSQDRANALGSLENIQREIASRRNRAPKQ